MSIKAVIVQLIVALVIINCHFSTCLFVLLVIADCGTKGEGKEV